MYALIGLVMLLHILYLYWYFFKGRDRRAHEPPVVKGYIPFVGCVMSFVHNPLQFLTRMRAKHGAVVTVAMGNGHVTFILEPSLFPILLNGKTPFGNDIRGLLMDRVFGPLKLLKYNAAMYALDKNQIFGIVNSADVSLKMMLKKPLKDGSYQMAWFCEQYMFTAVYHAIFGHTSDYVDEGVLKAFRDLRKYFYVLAMGVSPNLCPVVRDALQVLIKYMDLCSISKRKKVSCLVNRRINFGKKIGMSKTEIEKDLLSLMWETHSDVVASAFWCLYHILNLDQSEQGAVIKEARVDNCLGLGEQPLIMGIVNESLRLHASSLILRKVCEPISIECKGGVDKRYDLRVGDTVGFYTPLAHNHGTVFKQPKVFLHKRPIGTSKHMYMPFGIGTVKCPGSSLATGILQFFLTRILSAYSLKLESKANGKHLSITSKVEEPDYTVYLSLNQI
ncbi:p450 superfamily protein [Ranid herpesvirus 3]|uniref:p450 superfamily protein n=1 Tax=Ranid herpesvirus 3 TaxID=1987509 RepID=A0A1X9T5G7_9VIRU|nr:p450 superfamily protein [Ranid herpesvirus 3]ARR28948.1 p450 superfamily protein [Ranid herpesvirus 3]